MHEEKLQPPISERLREFRHPAYLRANADVPSQEVFRA